MQGALQDVDQRAANDSTHFKTNKNLHGYMAQSLIEGTTDLQILWYEKFKREYHQVKFYSKCSFEGDGCLSDKCTTKKHDFTILFQRWAMKENDFQ